MEGSNLALLFLTMRYNYDKPSIFLSMYGETYELYLYPKFKVHFDSRAGKCQNSLYPTVTIRQIMWAL